MKDSDRIEPEKYSSNKEDKEFRGVFVRDRGEGRGPRVAGPKPSDLSKIDQMAAMERLAQNQRNQDAAKLIADAKGNKHAFPIGPSGTRARKTKLAIMGLSAELLDQGDPRYAQCMRLANAYRKVRCREMYVAHGHVSSGVSSLLASASMALGAARFIYEIAADPEIEGRPGLLKTASSLSDSARQNELSAWELCARERVIKERNADGAKEVPWLVSGVSGEQKRGRGRPKKVDVVEGEIDE